MDKLDKKEIIEMSTEDLKAKLEELKEKYVELKVTHTVTPLENPIQLRSLRKVVARIETELRKRELNNS